MNLHGLTRNELLVKREHCIAYIKQGETEFGLKPSQQTAVIGKLGEIECCLLVHGAFPENSCQKGYDVISSTGRKISVKCTGQKTGFINVNPDNMHLVDDLMVLQYVDGALGVLYHDAIDKIVPLCRTHPKTGNLEFDISKMKRLGRKNDH